MAKAAAGPLKEIGLSGVGRIVVRPGTSDEAVVRQIFSEGQLDLSPYQQHSWTKSRYDNMVSAGQVPLIVDCGSNIGLSSIFFATQFPKARIIAIEPAADNVEIANINTANWPQIETIPAAVHDTATSLKIEDAGAEKWAYRMVEGHVGEGGVAAVTINDIVARVGASTLLLVKIDIEGGESALFRSNLEWLDKTGMLIIELHDWMLPGQFSSSTFFKAIEGRRFEMIQHGEHQCFYFET